LHEQNRGVPELLGHQPAQQWCGDPERDVGHDVVRVGQVDREQVRLDDVDPSGEASTQAGDGPRVELDGGDRSAEGEKCFRDSTVPGTELEDRTRRSVPKNGGHRCREPLVQQEVLPEFMAPAVRGDRSGCGRVRYGRVRCGRVRCGRR